MFANRRSIVSVFFLFSSLVSNVGQAGVFGSDFIRNAIAEAEARARAAAAAAATASANSCATVFVGGNGDGPSHIVGKNFYWDNLQSHLYARRSWHGGLNPHWSGKDRAWSDISSANVHTGCTLSIHRTPDASDSPIYLRADGAASTNFFGAEFQVTGQVRSLKCSCNDSVLPPAIGFGSMLPVKP